MTIYLTRGPFAGLAASLVAGALLLSAGGSHAAPQMAGVSMRSQGTIVHPTATRDHRHGPFWARQNSKTSMSQGGVVVRGGPPGRRRTVPTKVAPPPYIGPTWNRNYRRQLFENAKKQGRDNRSR